VEEDVGVAVLELLGDLESLPGRVVDDESGDAVPELFASFFLEDFPLSFALDNCSCYNISESEALDGGADETSGTGETHTTLCRKPFILSLSLQSQRCHVALLVRMLAVIDAPRCGCQRGCGVG
jgi:hypothetical protein